MADKPKVIKILLVEDNPDDILITEKAIKVAEILNQLWVARDGQEALDFLRHKGKYKDRANSPRPGLIFLDINLPKIDGIEVLKSIKQDPALKKIPVVMLTMSKRDEDILKSYDSGCNSFIQKPVEFEKFVEIVKQIGLYWGLLNIALPEEAQE